MGVGTAVTPLIFSFFITISHVITRLDGGAVGKRHKKQMVVVEEKLFISEELLQQKEAALI